MSQITYVATAIPILHNVFVFFNQKGVTQRCPLSAFLVVLTSGIKQNERLCGIKNSRSRECGQ